MDLTALFGSGWKVKTATFVYAFMEALKAVLPDYEPLLTGLQHTLVEPLGFIGIAHKVDKLRRSVD